MIAIPAVLTAQLADASPELRKELALDFAEHAVGECREAAAVDDGPAAYIGAARGFLRGTGAIEPVVEAHWRVWELVESDGLAHEVGLLAVLAVKVVCQRELAQAAGMAQWRHVPDVKDVVTSAQGLVGKCAAARTGGAGPDRAAVRRARWEEARWQLLRTIERAPNPH